MKAIGVIPSRYNSTRFPGKPLFVINGKTLLERVWRRAKKSRLLDEIIIATDDQRIFETAKRFNAKIFMTSKNCKSGTDRLAEVAKKTGKKYDIFINIQGDEPLISPLLIDNLIKELKKNKETSVVTAVYPLKNKKEILSPNVVKTVLDKKGFALYFSRYPIPYNRDKKKARYYKHIGIYGYRKDFLIKFSAMAQTGLEKTEQLEQLRILENGFKIKTILSKTDSLGVDVPQDIKKIQWMLS
ncbi:MAG: 3-deoxy-manno-octulosonate cytidylyltransferase [Elusimicrobia bacterium]|nr:3-deoxy-manno-octulosonate cytidylyltransferase [Elusimicrobiota bacterium]